MSIRALAALAALFWAWPAQAQHTEQISPALFAVRDSDSIIYLYGTVHVLPDGAEWSNARVRAAIAEAGEVWTESDIVGADAERFAADMMRSLETPAARRLSSRLPPEYRAILRFVAKAMGNADQVETLDPWELAIIMAAGESPGRSTAAGVDNQVVAAAQASGKTLRWLEDMGVAAFAALPERTQVEFLMAALDGVSGAAADIARGEAMWAAGDVEGLFEAEIAPMRSKYPALYAWIMTARNEAWVERLSAEMSGAGVDFVAVGAAHLVGPESVVAMLRARGFSVERVLD